MTLPVTAPDAHAACPPAPVQARRQEQMQRAWAQARYGLRDNHSELAEAGENMLPEGWGDGTATDTAWDTALFHHFARSASPPQSRPAGRRRVNGCIHAGCSKSASYGSAVDRRRVHCARHALVSEVQVSKRTCGHPNGCRVLPSFGFPGGPPRMCAAHQEVGQVCLTPKLCQFVQRGGSSQRQREKGRSASLNADGQSGREAGKCTASASHGINNHQQYCRKHAPANHPRVNHGRRCTFVEAHAELCTKMASYGPAGTRQRLRCAQHRKLDDIDQRSALCRFPSCNKTASFGPAVSAEETRKERIVQALLSEDAVHPSLTGSSLLRRSALHSPFPKSSQLSSESFSFTVALTARRWIRPCGLMH